MKGVIFISKAKKQHTYIEQRDVLNMPYIGSKEIMILLPICSSRADKERQEIEQYCKENNIHFFKTNPRLVPTTLIVEKYQIPVEQIRKEALKIEKYQFQERKE